MSTERSFHSFLGWGVIVVCGYVLSSGPVWCIVRHSSHPIDTMTTIYYPLTLLGDRATELLDRYMTLWAPPIR